jgi:hypothetical protein
MTIVRIIALTLLGLLPMTQEADEPHTLSLDTGVEREPATLDDVAWLAGHWQGEGMGGQVEEIWSPPQAGSMMGMFRFMQADQVNFYELLTLVPDGESLELRLKHFNSDLTGWEEKDDIVRFPLIKVSADRAWFNGLTFERVDGDHLMIHLMMRMTDGTRRDVEFDLHRVKD